MNHQVTYLLELIDGLRRQAWKWYWRSRAKNDFMMSEIQMRWNDKHAGELDGEYLFRQFQINQTSILIKLYKLN